MSDRPVPESDPEDFLTPALASEPGLLAPDRDLDLDFTWTNRCNVTDINKMTLTLDLFEPLADLDLDLAVPESEPELDPDLDLDLELDFESSLE